MRSDVLSWILRAVRTSLRRLRRREIAEKVGEALPKPYRTPTTEWPGEANRNSQIPLAQEFDDDIALAQINDPDTYIVKDPTLDPHPIPSGASPHSPQEVSPENLGASIEKAGTMDPDSLPPLQMPGRRNGPTQPARLVVDEQRARPDPPTPSSRPSLICREPPGSQQWEMVLAADEETGVVAVMQNGTQLKASNGEWPLSTFTGRLSVEFEDGSASDVPLFDGSPLIFKVSNGWKGSGHKARRLTNGHFILLAPKAWERLGHVPVEPAGCSDQEFMAHFFFRGSSDTAEEIGGFLGHEVPLGASCFELAGELVFDDSDEGRLFVGTPPQLNPSNAVSWATRGRGGT